MKTRIGVMIALLVATVLLSLRLVPAQQLSELPQPAQPAQPSQPSQPSQEAQPAQPSQPSQPAQPSQRSQPQQPQQPSQPRTPQPNMDPMGDVMFAPDLIMRHGRELGITDAQKSFMRGEIQKTTTRFNELQWQLQDAMEALGEIMRSSSVNEQQALLQLDKVLDAEREIKHLHIGMAIRIKNQLTPEQQAKLQVLRMAPSPHPQPAPGL